MAALYLDPLSAPGAWNVVQLGGLTTPGKAKVGKFTRKVEYDHKKGKATKGAAQTLKGLPPAEGEIEFWAWTPDHFAAWEDILALLKFDPTKQRSTTPAAASNTTTTATTQSGVPLGGLVSIPATGGADGTGGTSSFTGNTSTSTNSTSNDSPPLGSNYAIDIFHPAIAELEIAYVLPPEELGSWEEDGEGTGLYKRTIKFVEYTGTPPNTNIAVTSTGAQPDAQAPGQTPPGAAEPTAATAASTSAGSAAADAQNAWGAP
jgi:hypothetical protein